MQSEERLGRRMVGAMVVALLLMLLGACATPLQPDEALDHPPSLPPEEAAIAMQPPPIHVPDRIAAIAIEERKAQSQAHPKQNVSMPAAPDGYPAAPRPTSDPVQIPEVVVNANSLSGYWTIIAPGWAVLEFGLPLSAEVRYADAAHPVAICFLREHDGDLDSQCSNNGSRIGHGSVDGNSVTLRWWRGPLTLLFQSTVQNDGTLTGTFSGGVVGLKISGGVPVAATRLDPDLAPLDLPASHLLVEAVLADYDAARRSTELYDSAATLSPEPTSVSANPNPPKRRFTFLGTVYHRQKKDQAEFREDVYRVSLEAEESAQLCRIGTGETGLVRDFACYDIAF